MYTLIHLIHIIWVLVDVENKKLSVTFVCGLAGVWLYSDRLLQWLDSFRSGDGANLGSVLETVEAVEAADVGGLIPDLRPGPGHLAL